MSAGRRGGAGCCVAGKKKSKPKNLPAVVDAGRGIRQWWKTNDPGEVAEKTTLLGAVVDVGYLSLAHLARRMHDEKTPDTVKDTIALAFAPKVVAEFKGRMPAGQTSEPEQGSGLGPLEQAYGLTVRS